MCTNGTNLIREIEKITLHDNKTSRLGQQLEINCSFDYTIHAVFYGNVIGGNNEATNHSCLMAIKPAHFYNCLINMPILGSGTSLSKNFRAMGQSFNTAICDI